jgi:Transketolase, N-terminal subunit
MHSTPKNSIELAWLIRRDSIEMTHVSGASHIGSDLSAADAIAVLYFDVMKVDPEKPEDSNRDIFLMGKGHASAALYSCLANQGFFSRDRLKTFYQDGSTLSGHVTKHNNPGIELSTGSLGHALGIGVGFAYAFKQDKKANKVYVLMGDGECQEGSVYEALAEAGRDKLNNLIAVVDRNRQQGLGDTEDVYASMDLKARFESLGWDVLSVNGHDHAEIKKALSSKHEKPLVVISNTIKGYPVSFMENQLLWHYRFPHDGEEYNGARKELLKIKPAELTNPYETEDKAL